MTELITLTQFVSVSDYAKKKKITPQAVRKALKEKRLYGGKLGHQWIIPKDAAIRKERE